MALTPVSLVDVSPYWPSRESDPGGLAAYLTEQQMQPFPTSSHSSTFSSPLLTVRDFSMSSAKG